MNYFVRLISLLVILTHSSIVYSQTWAWSDLLNGEPNAGAEFQSLTTDSQNNVYAVGRNFERLIKGNDTLLKSENGEFFIYKADEFGNPIWLRTPFHVDPNITISKWFEPRSIILDASDNIYVTGTIRGNGIIFGSDTLTSSTINGAARIFILKCDLNASPIWIKLFDTYTTPILNVQSGVDLTLLKNGNIAMTGSFTNNTIFGNDTLTTSTRQDAFLTLIDPNGNILWTKFMNSISDSYGVAITSDDDLNLYLTGHYKNGITCQNLSISSSNLWYEFTSKFDSLGNIKWLKNIYGRSPGGTWDNDIKYHKGVLYKTGTFINTMTINSTSYNALDFYDIYVSSLDTTGNVNWISTSNLYGLDGANYIELDSTANLYVSGTISKPNFFCSDSISPINYITGQNIYDFQLLKFDSTGNMLWKYMYGTTGQYDYSMPIHCGNDQQLVLATGIRQGDMLLPNQTHFIIGEYGAFIGKLNDIPCCQFNPNFILPPFICNGDTLTLSAPSGFTNYLWSTGETTQQISIVNDQTIFYEYFDGLCRYESTPTQINFKPDFNINAQLNFICYPGGMGNEIEITASGFGTNPILWSTNDTNDSIYVNQPGDYFFTSTDVNGCEGNSDTIHFGLSQPNVDFTHQLDCFGVPLDFINFSSTNQYYDPIFSFTWNIDGNIFTTQNVSGFIPNQEIFDASLVVLTDNGCLDTLNIYNIELSNPIADYTVSSYCSNQNILFNDDSYNIASWDPIANWQWNIDGNFSNGNNTNYFVLNSGTLSTELIITTQNGCDDTIQFNLIFDSLIVADILQYNDTLLTSSAGDYQWYLDGVAIPGGNTQQIIISANGTYSLVVSNNCNSDSASIIVTSFLGVDNLIFDKKYLIFPNPTKDNISIYYPKGTHEIKITDLQGKLIQKINIINEGLNLKVNTSNISEGIYFVQFMNENIMTYTEKLIVIR